MVDFNPKFRYILPFHVTGHGQTFTLFAIWTMSNKENYEARYIGQVWLAINYCFASADIFDKVQNVDIGTYENWSAHSDHTPLIVDFDL